jgi:hypothetical protein
MEDTKLKRLLLFLKNALGRIMVQNNAAEEIHNLGDSLIDFEDIGIDKESIKYDITKTVTNSKSFN